ncbi:hypothetical protein [Rhodopseudomonas sp.]|uniref:hypothetical protein n=1 Tax=Rhodopseudomonas sp. TaxID=1078 RepID=UPI0039E24069
MVQIIYLDQNKWIDLLRAVKYPTDFPKLRRVLTRLVEESRTGQVIIPLTQTNIYETHKINDPDRRNDLAYVQATLSQGRVFRGRSKRLEIEIPAVLRKAYGLEPIECVPLWFLSEVFFEATLEWQDPRLAPISNRVVEAIRKAPARRLFEYLTLTPENVRRKAIINFTEQSEELKRRLETRRSHHANESLSMRRRLYSAAMMIDELDVILRLVRQAGLPEQDEHEILRKTSRQIVSDAPTYCIEREIALRLESQSRPIDQNDLRDMQAFSTVLAYANVVVAETLFANLTIQSGLHKKFGTVVTTDLLSLPDILCELSRSSTDT